MCKEIQFITFHFSKDQLSQGTFAGINLDIFDLLWMLVSQRANVRKRVVEENFITP